jgi:hypothetical protein
LLCKRVVIAMGGWHVADSSDQKQLLTAKPGFAVPVEKLGKVGLVCGPDNSALLCIFAQSGCVCRTPRPLAISPPVR